MLHVFLLITKLSVLCKHSRLPDKESISLSLSHHPLLARDAVSADVVSNRGLILDEELLVFDVHILLITIIWDITLCFSLI